jgi:RimJ/RimL family protein N-acetyltransferase
MSDERSWLPDGFVAPARLDLPGGQHLRPIRASDIELDYPAVMSSRPRLWALFGRAWGWPRADMTREEDLADLRRHEDEMERNASFNYAIFDREESELLGCVYVDPPEGDGADADVAWWVVDRMVGTELEEALGLAIPVWLRDAWPFERPRFADVG